MKQHNWYFGEILDEVDLDAAFADAETSIRQTNIEGRAPGIVSGCYVTPYNFDANSFWVSPGVVIGPQGERITLRDAGAGTLGGFITTDSDGNSTSPGAGNYRWITIAVRYGRSLLDPQTDDLSNTVYTRRPDSWNAQGVTFADDASQASNVAADGGVQIDDSGSSLNSFYVVAGPAVAISSPLSYPALPADAIILADVLFTDGDEGDVLNKLAISYARTQHAHDVDASVMGYPWDTDLTFHPRLLWEIENGSFKTRFYAGRDGIMITVNASYDATTSLWSADDTTIDASRVLIEYFALTVQHKHSADVGTPWGDGSGFTYNWDSSLQIGGGDSVTGAFGGINANGDASGVGTQVGYVSCGGTTSGSFANPGVRNAIQFPRAFIGAPSSVTLGSAGPNEMNLSGVSTGNISAHGCDFRVSIAIAGQFIAQRNYTATQ